MPSNTSTLFAPPPELPDRPDGPLVLFLDECIPRPLVHSLTEFLKDRPEKATAVHLLEFYQQGKSDREWAEEVRSKNWLPITADRGLTNRGEKLPRILRELGVVHVVLSAGIHQLPMRDKGVAIIAVWLRIVEVWRNQIGCTHALRFTNDKKAFRLIQVDKGGERSP